MWSNSYEYKPDNAGFQYPPIGSGMPGYDAQQQHHSPQAHPFGQAPGYDAHHQDYPPQQNFFGDPSGQAQPTPYHPGYPHSQDYSSTMGPVNQQLQPLAPHPGGPSASQIHHHGYSTGMQHPQQPLQGGAVHFQSGHTNHPPAPPREYRINSTDISWRATWMLTTGDQAFYASLDYDEPPDDDCVTHDVASNEKWCAVHGHSHNNQTLIIAFRDSKGHSRCHRLYSKNHETGCWFYCVSDKELSKSYPVRHFPWSHQHTSLEPVAYHVNPSYSSQQYPGSNNIPNSSGSGSTLGGPGLLPVANPNNGPPPGQEIYTANTMQGVIHGHVDPHYLFYPCSSTPKIMSEKETEEAYKYFGEWFPQKDRFVGFYEELGLDDEIYGVDLKPLDVLKKVAYAEGNDCYQNLQILHDTAIDPRTKVFKFSIWDHRKPEELITTFRWEIPTTTIDNAGNPVYFIIPFQGIKICGSERRSVGFGMR